MPESLFELPEAEEPRKEEGEGKPRVKRGEREQVRVIMASLDDLLPKDHRARLVGAMVERMDLSGFYARVKAIEGVAGRPAVDPQLLVALWLYATLEGVGSARELARLCVEDLPYRWLMGGVGVSYHTLSDFRVDYEQELDALVTQGVAAMMSQGLVEMERTAQDGLRVRASAGANSFHRRATLERDLKAAREWVQRVKREGEAQDQQGDTPRERAAQERAAREREQRLEQALEELQDVETRRAHSHHTKEELADPRKEPRSSSTDPEARLMTMAAGEQRPAYNAELAIDTQSRIIVGVELVNAPDQGQMDPMLEELHERTGRYPGEHLADKGFATKRDIESAFRKGVTVYAPLLKGKPDGPDPTQPREADGPGVRAWRERMTHEEAKHIYHERAATIEWANALARRRGFRQVLVRGLHKVRCVLLWLVLAHNLVQAHNLMAA